MLFVDGNWNPEMEAFRKPFEDFSKFANSHGISTLTISIDPDLEDESWEICQKLWGQIGDGKKQHGLKHFGGAGRIVWLDNGKILDYDWCAFLTNWDNIDDIDWITNRTNAAFE